jgi:hypothetical protein
LPRVWFAPGSDISSLSMFLTWALGSKWPERKNDHSNFHLLHRYDTYNRWSFASTSLIRLQGVVFLRPPLHNKGLGISFPLAPPRVGWGFSREDQGRGTTLGPISSSSPPVSKLRVIRPREIQNYELFTPYRNWDSSTHKVTKLLSIQFGENDKILVTEFDAYPFRAHLKNEALLTAATRSVSTF